MKKGTGVGVAIGILSFITALLTLLRDLFDFTLPWSPWVGVVSGAIFALILVWALIGLSSADQLLRRLLRTRERAYMRAFAQHSETRRVAEQAVELEARQRQRGRAREPSFLAKLREEQLEAGDFGERASTSSSEHEIDARSFPIAPPVSLFQAVTHAGNVVITGEPGTGKTTALQLLGLLLSDRRARRRYLERETLQAFEAAFRGRIPVFVRLQDFRQDRSMLDLVCSQIRLMVPAPRASGWLIDELDQYSSDHGVVLLLDSLDEMLVKLDPSERHGALRALEDFINARPKCKTILTSRVREYTVRPRLDVEFTLQELSPQQVRQFLEFRLGSEQDAQTVLEHLRSKQLHDFGRTPLIMTLLAFLHSVGKINFERLNRAMLFREYVILSVQREASRQQIAIDPLLVETSLADLALAQREGRAIQGQDDSAAILDLARSANLLKQYPARLEFWHEQLRDYFVAVALLPRFVEQQDFESFFEDPLWEDPLVMMAGLLEGDELTRLLEGTYKDGTVEQRVLITARCIGELALDSGLPLVGRVHSQAERMLYDPNSSTQRLGCRLLGELGTDAALDLLHRRLMLETDRSVKQELTIQLLRLDYLLYEKLERTESWQRWEAVDVMHRLKDHRFADALIQALDDDDWRVRQEAARALGTIGVEQAAERLISMLERDRDKRVRWAAAEALGQVGDLSVLPILGEMARSVTDEVSKPIALTAMQEIRKRHGEP